MQSIAEREAHRDRGAGGPPTARSRLKDLVRARESGEIPPSTYRRERARLLDQLVLPAAEPPAAADPSDPPAVPDAGWRGQDRARMWLAAAGTAFALLLAWLLSRSL